MGADIIFIHVSCMSFCIKMFLFCFDCSAKFSILLFISSSLFFSSFHPLCFFLKLKLGMLLDDFVCSCCCQKAFHPKPHTSIFKPATIVTELIHCLDG